MTVLGLHCSWWAFSSSGERGLLSSCVAWASHCSGFSCWGPWALGLVGFSSCGAQGMWSLPGPGVEPASPALADRLYHWATREPPLPPHTLFPYISQMFTKRLLAWWMVNIMDGPQWSPSPGIHTLDKHLSSSGGWTRWLTANWRIWQKWCEVTFIIGF